VGLDEVNLSVEAVVPLEENLVMLQPLVPEPLKYNEYDVEPVCILLPLTINLRSLYTCGILEKVILGFVPLEII
jgi:hypothetical protein